ncbi:MAG: Gfa-like protein [Parcubacteria bacterium C7867-007]|nr:MAG: Gfa-like protein [Parcubacteria bacterium C7867-007]
MKYNGACHCGAVKFEAEADLSTAVSCNCSHCQMKGLILVFVPKDNFTLLTPEAPLTEYLFNKKSIHHQFCSVCGVQPYAYGNGPEGTAMCGINLRCVESVDIDSLSPTKLNGKDF